MGVDGVTGSKQVQQPANNNSTTSSTKSSGISDTQIGSALANGTIGFIEQGVQSGDWANAASSTIKSMTSSLIKSALTDTLKDLFKLLSGRTDTADAAKDVKTSAAKKTKDVSKLQQLVTNAKEAGIAEAQQLLSSGLDAVNAKIEEATAAGDQGNAALEEERQLDEEYAESSKRLSEIDSILIDNKIDISKLSSENKDTQNTTNSWLSDIGKNDKQQYDFSGLQDLIDERKALTARMDEIDQRSKELCKIIQGSIETAEAAKVDATAIQEETRVNVESNVSSTLSSISSNTQAQTTEVIVEHGVNGVKDGVKSIKDIGEGTAAQTHAATEAGATMGLASADAARVAELGAEQIAAGGVRASTAAFEEIAMGFIETGTKSTMNLALNSLSDTIKTGLAESTGIDVSMIIDPTTSALSSGLSETISFKKSGTESA